MRAQRLGRDRAAGGGFTLIELLVVIAIIALLIGILLPALGSARLLGYQAVSLSNVKQIMAAQLQYEVDNNKMPLVRSGQGTGSSVPGDEGAGINTWSYGGKNNSLWWKTGGLNWADDPASTRPINPYMYSDIRYLEPEGPVSEYPLRKGRPSDNYREALELPVFRSPGDKVSYQQRWPQPNNQISSYDDVGTSYHTNLKWFFYMRDVQRLSFWDAFDRGTERIQRAVGFDPSRLVWVHDETADIVANDATEKGIIGEFNELNKSVMGFLDGHVTYIYVEPNKFRTDYYTFVFEQAGDNPPPL
jgi:prepilin-type N-terminal cleavage/methylation domain-containing protein